VYWAVEGPVGVMIPVVESPFAIPFTLQDTAVSVLPLTVAVKVSVSSVPMVADAGKICTRMPESIVTVATENELGWTVLVAKMTKLFGLGTDAGAV
jgi:hypothetical protein